MDWEKRAHILEAANADLKKKVSDLTHLLAPYEVQLGARCPWCHQPTMMVGQSPSAHPSCYLMAEVLEEVAMDPFPDSDLRSLLLTLQARARLALGKP